MNEGALGDGKIDRDGVYQKIIRRWVKTLNGSPHGQAGCLIDVDVIDFECIGCGDSPGDGAFADASGENLAAFRGKLLAIAQAAYGTIRRKDHSSSEDRTEQGATANLVNTGDPFETLSLGLALVFGLASHQY
jgi:hypothetical protein